jgi:hypothetical protein
MDVAEEAAYKAIHSPLRNKVLAAAWSNVSKMKKYYVQKCKHGVAVADWLEIYANSEDEAAKKLVRGTLRRAGKLGELRVRVRECGNLNNPTNFYADAVEHSE